MEKFDHVCWRTGALVLLAVFVHQRDEAVRVLGDIVHAVPTQMVRTNCNEDVGAIVNLVLAVHMEGKKPWALDELSNPPGTSWDEMQKRY